MQGSDPSLVTLLSDPRVAALVTEAGAWWLWRADGSALLATNEPGSRGLGATGASIAVERQYADSHPFAAQIIRIARTLPQDGTPRLERLRLSSRFGLDIVAAEARRIGGVITLKVSRPVDAALAREAAMAATQALSAPALLLTGSGERLAASLTAPAFSGLALDALVGVAWPSLKQEAERSSHARLDLVTGPMTLVSLPAIHGFLAVFETVAMPVPNKGIRLVETGSARGPLAMLVSGPPAVVQPPVAQPPVEAPQAGDPLPDPVPAAMSARPTVPATPAPHMRDGAGAAESLPRVTWRTDATDRFVFMDEPADVLAGLDLTEADRRFGIGQALVAAVQARATFSSIPARFPNGGDGLADVLVSGFPRFLRGGIFNGFSGIAQIVRGYAPPPAPLAPAAAPTSESPALPTGSQTGAPEADPIASGPELTPAPAPAPAPNVVPLRPASGETPRSPALSPSERNAFQEIARALAAAPEVQAPAKDVSRDALTAAEALPAVADDEQTGFVEAGTPDGPAPSAFGRDEPGDVPVPVVGALLNIASAEADALSLLDKLPVGIVVHRGNAILHANRTMLDWTGQENAAALEAAGGTAALFDPALDDAPPADRPLMVRHTTGTPTAVEARLMRVMWGGDTALAFVLTRASADEVVAAADLHGVQSRLDEVETILDTATDGIVVVGADGRIASMNRSAEALFGYETGDVTGRPFTTLFAQESHRSALDYVDGLLANGVASVLNDGREVIGRVKQGGLIPLFMTMGRAGTGKLAAVFRDITQWKRAEEDLVSARRQAEMASHQKSDFVAKISHEIRTPLNSIIGFSEVMMEERFGAVGNERYRDYLKDIHTAGGHVLSLINDLLDLSKIEAGKLELSFTSVDLNDIVQSQVAIMQPQANRERVIIRSSLQGRLPNVVADARSLRQVALNLLSNAIKFTPPGGQIIVSTALTEAGEAVLRVRDTGIGMTDEELKMAMEPFRQVTTTLPRAQAGTGLGLPLTKALVEANRASFGISSQPKQGTLVEIVFPPTRVLAE